MRKTGRTPGSERSNKGLTFVRFEVLLSVFSTSAVVLTRVSLNAVGANVINHSLYISTDRAMSDFHASGLARFTLAAGLRVGKIRSDIRKCSGSVKHYQNSNAKAVNEALRSLKAIANRSSKARARIPAEQQR